MQHNRNETSKSLALDMMLRAFMNSTEFQNIKFKNWDSVAKLIPGITAKQCLHRWEELRLSEGNVTGDYSGLTARGRPLSSSHNSVQFQHNQNFQYAPRPPKGGPPATNNSMESRSLKSSASAVLAGELHSYQSKLNRSKSDIAFRLQPSHVLSTQRDSYVSSNDADSKCNGNEHVSDNKLSGTAVKNPATSTGIPSIVVHVYDEAKNTKKDFTCPRDLIVKEMRYFADYLSSDVQIYDDVDISVHCDIGIFDWLMQYVKRGLLEDTAGNAFAEPLNKPSLKPGNVISILISSNFLKMPTLVEECLVYCHEHMAEIVQLPCNLNCVNDELLTRLADKFTAIECEDLPDKKDRIKNKLFSKKLQQLFEPTFSSSFSPSNASTLYRCLHCHSLLTTDQTTKLPCAPERMVIDWRGRINFKHERDPSWNINNYLVSLKEEGLNWHSIYWKLWGLVNDLHCSECGQFFQCSALASCPYHSQPATVSADGLTYYLCCQQPYNTFNTLAVARSGCQFKDHNVAMADEKLDSSPSLLSCRSEMHIGKLSSSVNARLKSAPPYIATPASTHSRGGTIQDKASRIKTVCNVLLAYRDTICTEGLRPNLSRAYKSDSDVSIFRHECESCHRSRPTTASTVNSDGVSTVSALSHETSQSSVRGAYQQQRCRNSRTKRYQQESFSDAEEDELEVQSTNSQEEECTNWRWDSSKTKLWNEDTQRKHDEKMMKAVLSMQLATVSQPHKKATAKRKDVYPGGIYARLEAQFKASVAAKSLNNVAAGTNKALRDKRSRVT